MNKTRIYTRELRINSIVYVKDVIREKGKDKWQWKCHYLDDYWFGYLGNVSPSDMCPVLLDLFLLQQMKDVVIPEKLAQDENFALRGSELRLVRSRYGYDIRYNKVKLANVKFLHQLQNIYYDFTGNDLINARNRQRVLDLMKPVPIKGDPGAKRAYIRLGNDEDFNLGGIENPYEFMV